MSFSERQRPITPMDHEARRQVQDARRMDRHYGVSEALNLTSRRDKQLVAFVLASSNIKRDINVLSNARYSDGDDIELLGIYRGANTEINIMLDAALAQYPADDKSRAFRIKNAVNYLIAQADDMRRQGLIKPSNGRKVIRDLASYWIESHGSLVNEHQVDISRFRSRYGFSRRGFYSADATDVGQVPVEIQLELPGQVDAAQLGFNYRRIQKMMRIGGLRSLKVESKSGTMPDYQLSASSRKTEGSGSMRRGKTIWADAAVEVNVDAIERKLKEMNQQASPKAWAKEISDAIRRGVVKEGAEHVVRSSTSFDRFKFWASGFGALATNPVNFLAFLKVFIGVQIGFNLISRVLHQFDKSNPGDFRWSIFSGPQRDRSTILRASSKVGSMFGSRLVRELPKEK